MRKVSIEVIWFIFIAILFSVFFLLEGFRLGGEILSPLISKNEQDREQILNFIYGYESFNELYLIMAFTTFFTIFQVRSNILINVCRVMLVLLIALSITSLYLRRNSKIMEKNKIINTIRFVSSTAITVSVAMFFANLIKGLPIDSNFNYIEGVSGFVTFFTVLLGGLAFVLISFHGATFLSIKIKGEISERLYKAGYVLGVFAIIITVILIGIGLEETMLFEKVTVRVLSVVLLLLICLTVYEFKIRNFKKSFIINEAIIVIAIVSLFISIFPNIMISSIDPRYNLTIYNTVINKTELVFLSKLIIALIPLEIGYIMWSIYMFKKRIKKT